MLIGYIRVSTEEQNLARQEKMMQEHNVEKVFAEKISGKNTERPELQEMLLFVRKGDTVIVESYSRLARNTKDLLNIVDELTKKGVNFISLKENIDTTTPQGKLVLTIFGALAEFEREQTRERQKEGIEIAKSKGVYKGRKPIDIDETTFKKHYDLWKQGKITATECMNELNLKPNTFYRRVKEYENK